jgi:hypothetical protein
VTTFFNVVRGEGFICCFEDFKINKFSRPQGIGPDSKPVYAVKIISYKNS